MSRTGLYTDVVKPAADFLSAALLLLIFSPFMIVIAVLLSFVNKGKVFFVQVRPGKNEKLFRLYKFRTMKDVVANALSAQTDNPDFTVSEAVRITWFGNILRKTSLDELPQLVNVLKGDMSVVGPRPLLTEYLSLYSPRQAKRHQVRPGITGWAQVNGRNALSWTQKFELDCWYVDHVSFITDLRILMATVHKVLKADGIKTSSGEIMPKFDGKN